MNQSLLGRLWNPLTRWDKWLLLIWVFCVSGSLLLFAYLSENPQIVLKIEERQPGIAYERGLELIEKGRIQEAVASFKRGRDFFRKIYEKTGEEGHKRQMVLNEIAIADTYSIHGTTDEMKVAVDIYAAAIRMIPDFADWTPHLRRADVLKRLERYEEAIESYTNVIKNGQGLMLFYALYGRGFSLARLGRVDEACDDWYFYIQYYDREVFEDYWQEFRRTAECANPRRDYIRGRAFQALGRDEEAKPCLKAYLEKEKNDIDARYYYESLIGSGFPQNFKPVTISSAFPPASKEPRLIDVIYYNIYAARDSVCTLQLNLSGEAVGTVIPEMEVFLNHNLLKNVLIHSSEPQIYPIEMNLRTGKNFLRLSMKHPKTPGIRAKAFLHGIEYKEG